MIEGFLLDRIDLQRGGMCVAETVKLSALIGTDEAETSLAFADVTVARAEITVYLAAGLKLPPAGLVQRSGLLLGDFQALHGMAPYALIIRFSDAVSGGEGEWGI
jgi:hypothetical protein